MRNGQQPNNGKHAYDEHGTVATSCGSPVLAWMWLVLLSLAQLLWSCELVQEQAMGMEQEMELELELELELEMELGLPCAASRSKTPRLLQHAHSPSSHHCCDAEHEQTPMQSAPPCQNSQPMDTQREPSPPCQQTPPPTLVLSP